MFASRFPLPAGMYQILTVEITYLDRMPATTPTATSAISTTSGPHRRLGTSIASLGSATGDLVLLDYELSISRADVSTADVVDAIMGAGREIKMYFIRELAALGIDSHILDVALARPSHSVVDIIPSTTTGTPGKSSTEEDARGSSVQFIVMCAVAGVSVFACLGCTFWANRKCRPPKRGSVPLPDFGLNADFCISSPSERISNEGGDDFVHPALLGTAGSVSSVGTDRKSHIVWDFDVAAAQLQIRSQCDEEDPSDECKSGASDSKMSEVCDDQSASTAPGNLFPDESATQSVDATSLACEMTPLFATGDVVEYFSTTNDQWIGGKVISSTYCNGVEFYDVSLRRPRCDVDQLRRGVLLQAMRAPLRCGELVEIRQSDGTWCQAKVCGAQPKIPTLYGYTVKLAQPREGCSDILNDVPASRLRRRFTPGALVCVHRSPYCPPQLGTVAADASTTATSQADGTPDVLVNIEYPEQWVREYVPLCRLRLREDTLLVAI
jgi:hypothetical protein